MPLTLATGYTWSNGDTITATRLNDSVNAATYSGSLEVAKGGTGATDAATARTNLGIGSMATRAVTISTSSPSGGSDGDIWFQYV